FVRQSKKDIVEACAKETTKANIEDLDDDYFGILVDESNDVSHRESQENKLEELLEFEEVHTGQGLNQEHGLQRSGDTRWGSHFKTLENFLIFFLQLLTCLRI
ncbi:uncharacterized protein LOC107009972, partial [Solanum pennellii]|uniref:Uncharacterized protein LOC107009972 n=1 Tax=Solanum pennellii TaxID=28526 RepID=A0ABM1G1S0_SOLPN